MTSASCTAVFFDIANTLASVRLSHAVDVQKLIVYPEIPSLLRSFVDAGVRLGIVADAPGTAGADFHAVLHRGGIGHLFDPSLIILGSTSFDEVFVEASAAFARASQCSSPALVYVSADPVALMRARSAGFRSAPHPALARRLADREAPLWYVRIRLPAEEPAAGKDLIDTGVVPFYVSPAASDGSGLLYAIVDESTILDLERAGMVVHRLGSAGAPQANDVYLVPEVSHDQRSLPANELADSLYALAPYRIDGSDEGMIVALPPDLLLSSLGLTRDIHATKLIPSVSLLEPPPVQEPLVPITVTPGATGLLRAEEVSVFARCITACQLAADVARYAGTDPDAGYARIRSRHVEHCGNARAVEMLIHDLTCAGRGMLRVEPREFKHGTSKLANVEAVLRRSEDETRPEVVIVSAHLDSIAIDEHTGLLRTELAPGADDDASGIAGVLAAARACVQLASRGIPHREIRFVLFNAEEVGLAGSGSYAAESRAHKELISAVLQMDMIGHDLNPPPLFELHTGFLPPWPGNGTTLQRTSRNLAELVARLRTEVSTDLAVPEIFADKNDPARSRSDHSSFLYAGFPACLASEDFFPGQGIEGDRNPHYHRSSDTKVNASYAADIARVVAAAAWVMATR